MEATLDNGYAVVDRAAARHRETGEPVYVPLALTANRHGRAIGRTVAGTPVGVGGVLGPANLEAFDLEVARTGSSTPPRPATSASIRR